MCFRYLPHTSFDLHALATPPAFVLSQDQTLQFISSAPPQRTGTALPTKIKAHTLTYCVARICCVAAPDKSDATSHRLSGLGSRQPLCPKRLSQLRLRHHILTIDCTVYLSKSSSAITNTNRLGAGSRSTPNGQPHIIPNGSHLSRGSSRYSSKSFSGSGWNCPWSTAEHLFHCCTAGYVHGRAAVILSIPGSIRFSGKAYAVQDAANMARLSQAKARDARGATRD